MPKLKTKSSTKGRFRVTGSGKLRRQHANHRHFLTKQAKKKKRAQRRSGAIDQSNEAAVRRWMPYA